MYTHNKCFFLFCLETGKIYEDIYVNMYVLIIMLLYHVFIAIFDSYTISMQIDLSNASINDAK